jgi:hypothetical protein
VSGAPDMSAIVAFFDGLLGAYESVIRNLLDGRGDQRFGIIRSLSEQADRVASCEREVTKMLEKIPATPPAAPPAAPASPPDDIPF